MQKYTNPKKARFQWAILLASIASIIFCSLAKIINGGQEVIGLWTIIGCFAGAILGIILGSRIESWGNSKIIVERGDAFVILFKYHNTNPNLANSNLIDQVLDNEIPFYDKNNDGRKWYLVRDLYRFAEAYK